ncbi:MAG: flavin reductase family protein [Alicyclobacillus herbarius]|uniref:flavin reductase family protein n=1 Tax=Alicyclobacillus herbarius TaxID=122960 RepID=UPI00042A7B9C|nr:flavin reductase family protein [Alicyclobacillus herbarius]MCL6632275.1 flavin reductase family protein [Alicyclobacillus herbarius]
MIAQFTSVDFRRAMAEFATGVTVVTTSDGEGVHGMTANSFTSVSLDPPLVLISVDKKANHNRYIPETQCFGVSVLAAHQEAVSQHFAGKTNRAIEESVRYKWYDGVPVLEDCLMRAACRLWATYDGGDHSLFVGRVYQLDRFEGNPLLFYKGKYHFL